MTSPNSSVVSVRADDFIATDCTRRESQQKSSAARAASAAVPYTPITVVTPRRELKGASFDSAAVL
jgi:hypothetical protein